MITVKNFKTKMCENKDECQFGDKCTFAHSVNELKKPMCTNILKYGTCTYGEECRYDHNIKNYQEPNKVSLSKQYFDLLFSDEPKNTNISSIFPQETEYINMTISKKEKDMENRKQIPCKYYMKGNCQNGTKC